MLYVFLVEEYIARLEDGSVIHLNSDSELKVPVNFGKNSRQVWLKGEGYFNVAKDKKSICCAYNKGGYCCVGD